MKTFQTVNFGKALIALFFAGMLLASSANSEVIATAAVANVSSTTITNAAEPTLGTFEPSEPGVLDTNHAASVTLPPLAAFAPNPKWGALFPVIGVVAAVAVTQLLRRRRIAQLRSDSSFGQ